ncbi:DNA mismatch repair protein MutS, partial [candidate division WWE3 bacterium]|nr:DNA mismatch repair protein MutS [candidate division WWE3 bacterium]
MPELEFETPMMQQYAEIKEGYPDALLFFRLGDFYELFMEDAQIGAEVLDITLTARDKGRDGRIPMCGVPFHSVDSYIGRLVHAGYKVAVCEQVSDADGSGIVEREVVRVITPGTILDENAVPGNEPNFLMILDMPISSKDQVAGVALVDIGTTQFIVTEVNVAPFSKELENLIAKFSPKECVLSQSSYDNGRLLSRLRQFSHLNMYPFPNWDTFAQKPGEILKDAFTVSSVESLGLKDNHKAQQVAAVAVGYLQETQKGKVKHLSFPQLYYPTEFVEMDRNTIFNLELFHTIREGEREGSLLWLLDETKTAMGGRMLRDWLARPSRSIDELQARLDVVEYFSDHYSQRTVAQELLENVQDIERILGRLNVGTGNARDLSGLRQSLIAIEELISFLTDENEKLFQAVAQSYTDQVREVKQRIQEAIKDEPAAQMRDGGMIRDGFSSQLDDLRSISSQGKEYLDNYLESQKKATGISNLKIDSNKVFGFYLEVSKSHIAKVPDSYIRKQTLVNAERYITQELKEYEEKVFSAQDKIVALEYELVQQVIEYVIARTKPIIATSRQVARLDVLVGFSELAQRNGYVRPDINDGT